MQENKRVWSLTALISHTDETTSSVSVIKDFNGLRYVNGTYVDFQPLCGITSFRNFIQILFGVAPPVNPNPTGIRSIAFSFFALTTNNAIHVIGTNDEIIPEITTDDLTTTMAELSNDPDFLPFFIQIGAHV
jgi:hypothetical protein